MRRLLLGLVVLLSACDPPTAPTRPVQCCAGVHQCYVPTEATCRAGYEPIWPR